MGVGWWVAVWLAGCGGSAACKLAEETAACPECYSGEVTCSYGRHSVTAASCGDCQARSGLYQRLCEVGVEDDRAAIEAGVVCTEPLP